MGVKSRTTIAAWYSEHPKLKLCNKVQAVMSCCSATGEGEGGGGEYSGNDFAPWGNDQQSNSGSIGSQSVSLQCTAEGIRLFYTLLLLHN